MDNPPVKSDDGAINHVLIAYLLFIITLCSIFVFYKILKDGCIVCLTGECFDFCSDSDEDNREYENV